MATTLTSLLTAQGGQLTQYPLSAKDQRNLTAKHAVRSADRSVLVEVPSEDDEADVIKLPTVEPSEVGSHIASKPSWPRWV